MVNKWLLVVMVTGVALTILVIGLHLMFYVPGAQWAGAALTAFAVIGWLIICHSVVYPPRPGRKD